jgi:hypothetical protein
LGKFILRFIWCFFKCNIVANKKEQTVEKTVLDYFYPISLLDIPSVLAKLNVLGDASAAMSASTFSVADGRYDTV